jgi:acetoacetyl-CoA reductase
LGCDVVNFESAAACVKSVYDEVGPVDVLANNAGMTRDMTFQKGLRFFLLERGAML